MKEIPTQHQEARTAFGREVKAAREARRLSQEQLADAMAEAGHSTHPTTIHKIEAGQRPTPLEEILTLAAVLEVPAADLLSPGGTRGARLRKLRTDLAQTERLINGQQLVAERLRRKIAELEEEN